MMYELSEQEQKDYDEAVKEYYEGDAESYKKDAAVLMEIKRHVSDEIYKIIETELTESEHPYHYRIEDDHSGTPQDADGYTIWIDQSCGETGDNYTGTICMELPDGTYFMWDYWM